MRRILTPTAVKNYTEAPLAIRKAFDKQTKFLVNNLNHPSLHAKKQMKLITFGRLASTAVGVFYFLIDDNAYVILSIKPHPK